MQKYDFFPKNMPAFARLFRRSADGLDKLNLLSESASAQESTLTQTLQFQGGESRDLFRLFRTCIRTGPVRKLFIISLILNEFSCGDVHMSCLCNQQTNIEVFCAYAL